MGLRMAYEGVKKINSAMMLSLVATAAATGMLLIAAFMLVLSRAVPVSIIYSICLALLGLMSLASVVLAVAAAIMQLIGIANARKVEPMFGNAFYVIIACIVLNVIGSVVSAVANSYAGAIIMAVSSFVGVFTGIIIIKGIMLLAGRLGDDVMQMRGRSLIPKYAILYVISVITTLAVWLMPESAAIPALIAAVVAVASGVAGSVLMLTYTKSAVEMLKRPAEDPDFIPDF